MVATYFTIRMLFGLLMLSTIGLAKFPYTDDVPEIVTPDQLPEELIDEHGIYWYKKSQPESEMETLLSGRGSSDKRFWGDEDEEGDNSAGSENSSTSNDKKGSEGSKEGTDSNAKETGGSAKDCKVLESGILECNGVTTADATNSAKKFIACSAAADTCPEDGDVCRAPPATSKETTEAKQKEKEDALECSPGWLKENNLCYDAAYKMRATHKAAQQYCKLVGSNLMYPITFAEAKKILQFMREAWIGAVYKESADGGWQWLDGTPLPANVSLLGGLHPEPGRRCVRIRSDTLGDHVSFVKSKCGSLNPFVCRATLVEQLQHQHRMAEEKAIPGQCPNRWTLIAGYCHFTPKLAGDWSNGELWCNHHHDSKLVALLSREHELAVDKLVGSNISYHIGMRFRRPTSSWGWMNGEASTYRNWKHGGDPAYAGGEKDVTCAFRHTRKDYWAPVECQSEKIFVCVFKLTDASSTDITEEKPKSNFVDVENISGKTKKIDVMRENSSDQFDE